MAKPGTKVTELENPVIGFGGGSKNGTVKQYDGYPYSLDFSLSLMDPSRITISFISEDRKYDIKALNEDIVEAGTRTWAKQIEYCGGGEHTFYGYPMKYSINRSPRGDILTVDYYDASIVELDNCYVLLNGKDFPLVSSPNEEGGAIPFNNIQENPCLWGIFNLGTEYVRNAAGIPQSNPACIDEETLSPEVLYSNYELAAKIQENIAVDPDTINVLAPKKGGEEDPDQTFLEAYHGTLRDVLKQWGQRMGFTFYWDPKNDEQGGPGGADRNKQGRLVFLDLKAGLFYDGLKTISDKMLGKTSGGAANLLDSTESVSREQTFNKAISARYENAGIGDAVVTDKMMILDMLTLPIRGCVTDVGREWSIAQYDRGIKSDGGGKVTGFEDGSPQWRWTNENAEWYKEWDSANYGPFAPQDKDKQERKWLDYQPKRPVNALGPGGELDETGEEFRDYVRLVKAAAIGRDFFKAYIFFKAMKRSDIEEGNPKTLLDVMQYNPQGTDINATVMPCPDALAQVLESGVRVVAGEGPDAKEYGKEGDEIDPELLKICCGAKALDIEKSIEEAAKVTIVDPEGVIPVNQGGIQFKNNCGLAEGNFIVPDLVENKALTKILSALDSAAGEDPGYPNVKLCRKTVVGANCLTVGVLDPCFEATRLLYSQIGGDSKTGCQKNEAVSVEVMDTADDVYRINIKKGGPGDAEENGSPYIFTHVYNFGNSLVLDSERHDALYSQLKFVAENAGRFWVASEPVTEREYRRRSYDEDGISWVNKLLDVNNTNLRGLFQTFDPTAPRSFAPFSEEGPPVYQEFWGEEFQKEGDSRQKQLNGFENLDPPVDGFPNPCGYDEGEEFSPSKTQTGENTRAPNYEQMIEKIIDKNLNEKTGIPCRQNNTMAMFIDMQPATMQIGVDQLIPKTDDNDVIIGYHLKPIYYSPKDFFGGAGYGVHPTITVSGGGILDVDLSKKTIIHDTVITQIIFENPEDVLIEVGDGGAPDITVEISPPEDGEINFFKHIRFGEGGTSMFDMDSITSTNLSRRQEQREIACCCTDLEEGIVMHDAGELLIMNFNNETKKQIERFSQATNLTIGSQFAGNLVKDYQRDNKLITMSTNLIPIDKCGVNPTNAKDELDWLVDQVKLGKIGADPSYEQNGFVMPVTPDNIDNTSGLADCEMDTKDIKYILKGEKFESVVFGMVVNDPQSDNVNANGQPVKTVPAGGGDLLEDCTGFIWADGVNVKQMTIDFETPTTEEIGIEFECGKEWIDLTEEEQKEKLIEIQENLASYVRKRAYLQDKTSYEASATIADMAFLNKSGGKVKFQAAGEDVEGMPTIKQGLESLSIKVDGNGIKVTVSVGTRKKLLGLRDSNTNLWKEMNPRTMNQLQMNNPGGN